MNSQEAEQRFKALEQQLTAGQITLDQYRVGLNELRVYDSAGRLWMPQERTGAWYVYLNGQWQPASVVQSPQTPPSYAPANAVPIPPTRQSSTPAKSGGKLGVTLIIWFIIFMIIAVVAWFLSKEAMVVLTVGAIALFSLVLILVTAVSAWEGQVVDIRAETKRTRDSSGHTHTRVVRNAYIRQPNGSTKKTSAGNWQVGDYIVKRRGEMSPRVQN
jgi:hypothetical protein